MHIAIVDDNATNCILLRHLVRKTSECDVDLFQRSEDALEAFRTRSYDIGIFDYHMPGLNGASLIAKVREREVHSDIPLLVVTTFDEQEVRLEAIEAGATDFLRKPVNAVEFRARFRNILTVRRAQIALRDRAAWLEHNVNVATQRLSQREQEIILRLSRAAEYRDNETGQHTGRVAAYARDIAEALGCDSTFVALLHRAAPMHDIGKVAVADAILLKPAALTPDEWAVMKLHTEAGAAILAGSQSDLVQLGETIARSHHERWDGSGYPDGLAGEAIPLAARIVAVADVFDALTSRRPYKPAWTAEAARREIKNGRGTQFDPACVDAFLARFDRILAVRRDQPDPHDLPQLDFAI